jgi:hypothetical protein
MLSENSSTGSCRSVFGFAVETEADLGVDLPRISGPPDLRLAVRRVDRLPPPDGELVYASDPAEGSGAGVTVYRTAAHSIVRFRDTNEFRISDDLIECDLLSPDYAYLVRIQYLGIVMAVWMELRGFPVLHASSVVVDDRGVAFLAAKRGGKTSLAATMVRKGYRFLSDDLVCLDTTTGTVLARPAYPQFRMEPDVANHFVPEWDSLPIVHPAYEKRRVPLALIGEEQPTPVPLGNIYVPERIDVGDLTISQLSGTDALLELLRGSFLPEIVAGLGLESKRLARLGKVASVVPVKHLRYPSGFDHLTRVAAAIRNDMAV